MSARTIKASMIDDADILLRIARHNATPRASMLHLGGTYYPWAHVWDLAEWYPTIPPKVLRSKAGQLIKRGLIDGCNCGCRGDFEITAKGAAWLASPAAPSS